MAPSYGSLYYWETTPNTPVHAPFYVMHGLPYSKDSINSYPPYAASVKGRLVQRISDMELLYRSNPIDQASWLHICCIRMALFPEPVCSMTYTSQKGSNVAKSLPFVLYYHRSTLSISLDPFTSLLIPLTWLSLQNCSSSFVQPYLSVLRILFRILLRFLTRVLSVQYSLPVRLLSILTARPPMLQAQFTVWEALALPELQVSQISSPRASCRS